MSDPDGSESMRLANIFVIVALVAMLIGAILIISARETFVADVASGESVVLLDESSPGRDPLGHSLRLVVHGPANATLHVGGPPPAAPDGQVLVWVEETTGDGEGTERENVTLGIGQRATWRHDIEPGERWVVEVMNGWEDDMRISATVSSTTTYVAGGVLVGIGVLGFISYRIGIRRGG